MRKLVTVQFFVLSCCLFQMVYADAPAGRYTDEKGQPLTSRSLQVKDTVTGLIWQRGRSDKTQTWGSFTVEGYAQAYCAALVIESMGAWRLPSVKELATLVDVSTTTPAIDINVFPDTPSDAFWSSTDCNRSYYPCFIDFTDGKLYFNNPNNTYHVRCVR